MNELVLRVVTAAIRAWSRPIAIRRPRRTVPGNRKRFLTPVQRLAKRRRDQKWRALHKSQINLKRRLRYKSQHGFSTSRRPVSFFRPRRTA